MVLHSVCPRTRGILRFRSVRIARRLSSLRTLHPIGPKACRASRLLCSGYPKVSFPSHAPLEPPEGIPRVALAPFRSPESVRPVAPVHSSRPKTAVTFRFGRRGRARSSEESQHSRPPAPSQCLRAEALPHCVDCLGSLQCPRLPGFISGSPLQPMDAPPEGFLPMFGHRFACARPLRLRAPNLTQRGPMSTPKFLASPCGSVRLIGDQVLELPVDFSTVRPRSRCHQAVTNSESRQAGNARQGLWITWISCTSRASPAPSPRRGIGTPCNRSVAGTLRHRH